MGVRQRHELSFAGTGEKEPHDAVIVGVGHTLDQSGTLGAIDKFDCAVVLQEEVGRDVADRRRLPMTPDREKQLMLRARQTDVLGLVLAPT